MTATSTKLLLAAGLLVGVACGAKPGATGTTAAVEYSVNAQINYDKGVKELDRHDWIAASQYFSFITSRFPYSKYALLAEIGLADAQVGTEHYAAAIDAYLHFIQNNPAHDMVENGTVARRIGEAYRRSNCGH